jgi:transposase-like protein
VSVAGAISIMVEGTTSSSLTLLQRAARPGKAQGRRAGQADAGAVDAQARAADPDGLSMTEREELRALRKELIELRTDREILRKAAASFARETTR